MLTTIDDFDPAIGDNAGLAGRLASSLSNRTRETFSEAWSICMHKVALTLNPNTLDITLTLTSIPILILIEICMRF